PLTAAPLTTPVLANGVYQAQMPVYDNPSVFTGLPVTTSPMTSLRVPTTAVPQTLRGQLPSVNRPLSINSGLGTGSASGYFGANNIYPTNNPYANSLPYTAGYAPTATVPTTTNLFPNAPVYRPGPVARFFGSLFGTSYRNTVSPAQVTYYRPVTSYSPALGTTLTTQAPCVTSINQAQRVPFTTFQGGLPTSVATTCTGGACGTVSSGVAPVSGFGVGPAPISQIPSTSFGPSASLAPTTTLPPSGTGSAPLTGSYASPSFQPGPAPSAGSVFTAPSDAQPMAQPRLESSRQSLDDSRTRAQRPSSSIQRDLDNAVEDMKDELDRLPSYFEDVDRQSESSARSLPPFAGRGRDTFTSQVNRTSFEESNNRPIKELPSSVPRTQATQKSQWDLSPGQMLPRQNRGSITSASARSGYSNTLTTNPSDREPPRQNRWQRIR
ncbi:MAG: hypothetical protein AAF664_15860, partial [Planctomycetota bacterium]